MNDMGTFFAEHGQIVCNHLEWKGLAAPYLWRSLVDKQYRVFETLNGLTGAGFANSHAISRTASRRDSPRGC